MLATFSGTVGGQLTQVLLYMVMSRDRNAGRGDGVKFGNRSTERVEEFKYRGATLTDQTCIQEEIQGRLK
jgi:hypothetical protein